MFEIMPRSPGPDHEQKPSSRQPSARRGRLSPGNPLSCLLWAPLGRRRGSSVSALHLPPSLVLRGPTPPCAAKSGSPHCHSPLCTPHPLHDPSTHDGRVEGLQFGAIRNRGAKKAHGFLSAGCVSGHQCHGHTAPAVPAVTASATGHVAKLLGAPAHSAGLCQSSSQGLRVGPCRWLYLESLMTTCCSPMT